MSSLYGNAYTVVAANGQAPIDGPLCVNSNLVASALAAGQARAGTAATGPVAISLTASSCGSIIQIPGIGTSEYLTITLPPAAQNPGFYCKFTLTAVAAKVVTIDSGVAAGLIGTQQTSNNGAVTTSYSPTALSRSATFTATGANGDVIDVWTDGNKYFANLFSSVTAGVALA
jgi:hypothetical protein